MADGNGNTNWQNLSQFLVGLLVGGIAAGSIGHYQYGVLREELRTEIAQVRAIAAKNASENSQVLVEIGRLQEQVRGVREDIRDIRDIRN